MNVRVAVSIVSDPEHTSAFVFKNLADIIKLVDQLSTNTFPAISSGKGSVQITHYES